MSTVHDYKVKANVRKNGAIGVFYPVYREVQAVGIEMARKFAINDLHIEGFELCGVTVSPQHHEAHP